MKFAKFIYPMFLVALGLHGLLLFIPIGGEAEQVEEDVTISALETGPRLSRDREETALSPLPVPDLNVSTSPIGTPSKAITAAAPARRAATRTATRTARTTVIANRGRSTDARAGIAENGNRQPSNSAVTAATDTNNTQSPSPSQTAQASGQSSSQSSDLPNPSSDNASPSTQQQTPSPPPSIERGTSETERNVAVNPTVGQTDSSDRNLSRLLSSARGVAIDSLIKLRQNLKAELTYKAEGTKNATQRRDDWKEQNNLISFEALAPDQAADLSAIQYPIEVSKQPKRRAFQLCLDQPPNSGEIGIIFDEQGNVSSTTVLRSTGYSAIDNEIVAKTESYQKFPLSRHSKAYTLPVEVEYNANECISLPELKQSAGS